MCIRSKAWLAASVWLRLARLPPPASRLRRSRRLRDTLAAAPGLLAHASVTEIVNCCPMGPKLRHPGAIPWNSELALIRGSHSEAREHRPHSTAECDRHDRKLDHACCASGRVHAIIRACQHVECHSRRQRRRMSPQQSCAQLQRRRPVMAAYKQQMQ